MWRADGKWCLILLHSVFSPYGQVIKLQLADSDYLVSRPTLTSWLHRVAQTRKCTMYTGLRSVNFIVSNLFAGDGSGVENYSNLFYTHLATYLPLILLWQPISKSYSRRHPYYPWFSFLIMLCSNLNLLITWETWSYVPNLQNSDYFEPSYSNLKKMEDLQKLESYSI